MWQDISFHFAAKPQPKAKQHAAPTTTGVQTRKRQGQYPPLWPKLRNSNSAAPRLPSHLLLEDVKPEVSEGLKRWKAIVKSYERERSQRDAGKKPRPQPHPSSTTSRSLPSTPPASSDNQAPNEADVGEKGPTLLDLPDHVITKIISLLPVRDVVCGLRQTCTRLHDITLLPDTWTRVEMTFKNTINHKAGDLAAGRYYSGLLGQRFSAFRVRRLDHDPARREKEDCGGAELVSGRREECEDGAENSAVLNVEGSQDRADKSIVLNGEEHKDGAEESAVLNVDRSQDGAEKSAVLKKQVAKDEDDAGHDSNAAADEETSRVKRVETEMRHGVRSLSEHYADLSPRLTSLSIVNGALYPSLQDLSLTSDFFPDPAFLSRHTGLRSLFLNITAPWWAPDYPVDNIRKMFHELRACKSLEILKIQMQINLVYERMFRAVGMWPALLGYFASGPVLRRLRLDMPVDDIIVRSILDHCPQLEELQLYSRRLTIGAFEHLLETPNTLITSLTLYCRVTEPRLVYGISKAFHGLTELCLSLMTPAEDYESPEYLTKWQQVIDTLMLPQAFPKLTFLKVRVVKARIIGRTEFRTDDPLFSLNSQPVKGKLKNVSITDETSALSFDFNRLCSAHPHLENLDIKGTTRHSFSGLLEAGNQAITTWFTLGQISTFSLTGMAVLRALPDLENLPCPVIRVPSGQPEMPGPMIQELSGQPEGLASDPGDYTLNELPADNTGDIYQICMPRPFVHLSLVILQCPTLCDKDVLVILLSCPRLQQLWLESKPPSCSLLLTEKTLHNFLELGTELRYVMFPHRMELGSPDSLARLLACARSLATISINAAHYEDERFMVDLLHAWSRIMDSLQKANAERKKRDIAVRRKWLEWRGVKIEGLVCFSVMEGSAEVGVEAQDIVKYVG